MTLTEASQYLDTGIKRAGWGGYIVASVTGAIIFIRPDGTYDTWLPYKQDIDAEDWERVTK